MSDIVQVSFDSPADAGRAFKLALSGRDAEQRESVLALIRQNPTAALAVLGNADSDLGLSPRQSSDALDLIVETIGTDSQSKDLLTDYLSAERTAELLTGRGDLPSSAAFVIDADALILAIVKDVTSDTGHPLLEKEEGAELEEEDVEDTSPGGEDDEETRNAAPAYQEEAQTVEDDDSRLTPEYRRDTADRLCRWAYKIKDRPDYGDICSRVIGTYSWGSIPSSSMVDLWTSTSWLVAIANKIHSLKEYVPITRITIIDSSQHLDQPGRHRDHVCEPFDCLRHHTTSARRSIST
jgi:hypothetical protein